MTSLHLCFSDPADQQTGQGEQFPVLGHHSSFAAVTGYSHLFVLWGQRRQLLYVTFAGLTSACLLRVSPTSLHFFIHMSNIFRGILSPLL